MKNEYSKYGQSKNYQAANKHENRNPNAPTQGGFSTPGSGQNQKDKSQLNKPQGQKNPHQGNKQPNAWGTASIRTDKDNYK